MKVIPHEKSVHHSHIPIKQTKQFKQAQLTHVQQIDGKIQHTLFFYDDIGLIACYSTPVKKKSDPSA